MVILAVCTIFSVDKNHYKPIINGVNSCNENLLKSIKESISPVLQYLTFLSGFTLILETILTNANVSKTGTLDAHRRLRLTIGLGDSAARAT